ncbi:MAG: rRNA maturation RNase YbeY [Betaproteobacteria bacterium]|nr:rRNA maturation RNase YbeY [Betaproteobacteria bacterium]
MPSSLRLSLQWAMPRAPEAWPLPRPRIRRLLLASLGAQGILAEITVRLVGQKEGRQINREFRGKDYATNVLTFAYQHHPVVQADLVLCLPILTREAGAQHKDLSAHFAHMLVHGMLHAQGLDHEDPEEAEHMEGLERRILKRFRLPDPYSVH